MHRFGCVLTRRIGTCSCGACDVMRLVVCTDRPLSWVMPQSCDTGRNSSCIRGGRQLAEFSGDYLR